LVNRSEEHRLVELSGDLQLVAFYGLERYEHCRSDSYTIGYHDVYPDRDFGRLFGQ
jgi:hypothetical protein